MSDRDLASSDEPWRPQRSPHARVVRDAVRNRDALLDPERVIFLSSSARAILALCDGARTTHEIIDALRARFPKAPLERDVPRALASLHAAGALAFSARAPTSTDAPSPFERDESSRDESSRDERLAPPLAMTAELTYRCPLRCGYCSNPVDLHAYADALSVDDWLEIIDQAADAGVLQCSFSGGEPLLFHGLEPLVARARARGMYTNLITSAWGLSDERVESLARAGLDHVQISVQHVDEARADALAGARGAHTQKLEAARRVVQRGLALSINVVLHRSSIEHTDALIDLAESLGASRIELASVQSHGWALRNRAALLPTRAQVEEASRTARRRRAELRSKMRVVYVIADYFADRPKPCMDGWGRKFLTVTPDGRLLPCPGAHALPLPFDRVPGPRSIEELWRTSAAFDAYRGTSWMLEPCASCDERERDYGGCRCQAFALTGDARRADPACSKSPDHGSIVRARAESEGEAPLVELRRYTRDR